MNLDAGDGQILLITIRTGAANFETALAAAMPVIETFQFTAEAH